MRNIILILIFMMLIYSCNNNRTKLESSKSKRSVTLKPFKKDVPINARGDTNVIYKIVQHNSKRSFMQQ